MLEEIKFNANWLKEKIKNPIDTGIILGSGLGGLADKIEDSVKIPYSTIPNFPQSTVKGHDGAFIFGYLAGKYVMAMKGRFHYYEGYSMEKVVRPVRVMKMLGINKLLLSNAAGGVNPSFKVGDVMIITDHINLFPENPLRGKNIDELGPRFPDMSEPYKKSWSKTAFNYAKSKSYPIQKGIYTGVSGPTYETPAEYKFIQIIGSDAVGMSTVPEVIAAKHMGMDCFACSIITDMGTPDEIEEISHDMVTNVAEKATPILTDIFSFIIKEI